jgi:hypothetical protein
MSHPADPPKTTTDAPAGEGDFEVAASAATPTEAHLLKGVLESAGLDAVVADGHLLQAYDWLTPAAGGVRVLVPAAQMNAALQALAAYRAGDLALEGEPLPAQPIERPAAPLYSVDLAVLFSFLMLPAFGAGVHLLNARVLQPRGAGALAWGWFLLLLSVSLGAWVMVAQGLRAAANPSLVALFASLLTAFWYVSFAQGRNRALVERFGVSYPRRSLLPLAAGALALHLAAVWLAARLA